MSSGPFIAEIEKSETDHRSYRHVTLKNKLQCLLVSDPQADKGAAALEVAVGSASDPIPGLAHFCEHMLFLGTEKYPDENSYSAFLAEHGGTSNAYTAHENTNYHFDVTPDHLEPALDRFSQFFIAPLFTKSATEREMLAVHNEDAKNKLDDAWRGMQLLQSTSNPDHALNHFGTGNLTTLRDEPLKQGLDVRQLLLDFHKRHYSANQMKLCIVGKNSLDQLEEWAQDKFSAVENNDREDLRFGGDIFLPEHLKKVYKVVPIKEIRQLSLAWHVPPETPVYKHKPIHLLSHLLGHEGQGSLLSYLKEKGWINGLSSGPQLHGREYAIFAVSMDLTEEGLHKTNEIAEAVFAYVNLLNQASEAEWRQNFDEAAQIADMNFRFKGIEQPIQYAATLAAMLSDFPPEHVLSGPWKYWSFDLDIMKQYLAHLTPDLVRIHVVDQSFKGKTDKVEEWYGTEYSTEDISEAQLETFRKASLPELHLPKENPFIPSEFSLKPNPALPEGVSRAVAEEKELDAPKMIPTEITTVEQDGIRTWWKQDDTFFRPHGHVFIHLETPIGYNSPESHVLTALFIRLVDDSLTEYTYDALMAGFHFSVSTDDTGVTIHVRGYDHKLDVLLSALLARMRDLVVNEERFSLIRETFVRRLKNFDLHQPYMHAVYNTAYCLMNRIWHEYEQLEALNQITSDDLRAFIPQLLQRGQLQMFVFGNFTEKEARDLAFQTRDTLRLQPLWPGMVPELRCVALEPGKRYRRTWEAPNPAEVNSSTIFSYELGRFEPEQDAVVSLLSQVMQEPAFNQLRTKEQLGYLVFSGTGQEKGIILLRILVQSSDRSAEYLEGRIAAFVEQFGEILEEMDGETFQHHKEALIAQRLEKDKTSKEESLRHWGEISHRMYEFHRAEKDAECIARVTKADVIQLYKDAIAIGAPNRRLLISRVEGHPAPATGAEEGVPVEAPPEPEAGEEESLRPVPEDPSAVVEIEDPVTFKKSMPLHPQYI